MNSTAYNNDSDSGNDIGLDNAQISDPEEVLIDRERNTNFVKDLKALLSGLEISVLSLYLNGAPYNEMSARLGKPAKSIANALQSVKRKLEKYLV